MVAENCADKAANAEKQARVKARWGLLRQALLGTKDNNTKDGGCTNTEQHSMHSFPGFQILDRTILSHDDALRAMMDNDTITSLTNDCDSDADTWDIVQYTYTSKNTRHRVQFHTREAATKQQHEKSTTIQSRMEALLSHRNYGVDNTGNVRVWDAESTLSGFLLSLVMDNDDGVHETKEDDEQLLDLKKILRSTLLTTYSPRKETTMSTCNLLELGSGQAGLCGLAVAMASSADKYNNDSNEKMMRPLNIILTDGHPKCVKNNDVCSNLLPDSCQAIVEAHMLLWDSSCNGANRCHQINKLVQGASLSSPTEDDAITDDEGQYHLCVASDCVHFQEFHDGLLTTIARTLAVNGIALLCQPTRGTSLQNFMDLVDAVNDTTGQSTTATNQTSKDGPLFQMNLYTDFHPKVSEMHKSLLSESTDGTNYDPNWHRPLLLVLQKLRMYNEEIDGEISRRHVRRREAK